MFKSILIDVNWGFKIIPEILFLIHFIRKQMYPSFLKKKKLLLRVLLRIENPTLRVGRYIQIPTSCRYSTTLQTSVVTANTSSLLCSQRCDLPRRKSCLNFITRLR